MVDDTPQGVGTDETFSDEFVPILVRRQGVLAVVEVNGAQPLQSDDVVKLIHHIIQMIHDVVARIVDVAGVQANAYLVVLSRAVNDLS